jgi:hypothetical protein
MSLEDPPGSVVRFDTHDNGARPFQVVVDPELHPFATVFQRMWSEYDDELGPIRVGSFDAVALFAGRDRRCPSEASVGNSVLLMLRGDGSSGHRYVYVGDCVYAFETPEDDPVLHYFSRVVEGDVPYPVALGARRVYFMLDRASVLRCEFGPEPEDFLDWEDAYSRFWQGVANDASRQQPLSSLVFIEGR